MKKKLLVLPLLMIVFAFGVFAQGRKEMRDENNPEVQKMRKEYFNEALQFTDAEAEAFWPIFTKHKEEMKALQQLQNRPRLELMSDAEAEQYLTDHFVKEEKLLALRKQFVNDLRGKIGVRKIALIAQTERKFKRELFAKIRAKRGEERREGREGRLEKRRF